MSKFFNKNLKFIREQKGISQQELADKIGTDRSTISRWENNEMDATVEKALQVAKALNVPYPNFLGTDMTEGNTKYEKCAILYDKLKDLSDEDIALIENIVETRRKQINKELGDDEYE